MLATGIVPTEASVAARTMKPEPVTPAAPFEVSRRIGDDAQFLRQGQVGVGCLGEEHRRHRQIDAGSIEIEGVSGGDHQPND